MKIKEILTRLGLLFTEQWVKSSGRKELNGFEESAECCFEKAKRFWRTEKLCIIFSILTAIMMIVAIIGFVNGLEWTTALLALVALIWACSETSKKIYYPGETALSIAKEWKEVRKDLVRLGITHRISRMESIDPWDTMKPWLEKALNQSMQSLGHILAISERDGFKKKAESAREKMSETGKLGQKFQISLPFDSYIN